MRIKGRAVVGCPLFSSFVGGAHALVVRWCRFFFLENRLANGRRWRPARGRRSLVPPAADRRVTRGACELRAAALSCGFGASGACLSGAGAGAGGFCVWRFPGVTREWFEQFCVSVVRLLLRR